jgi:hypothetical protein
MTTGSETREEITRFELIGAEHRLERAVRALRDFQRVFGHVSDEGVFKFRAGIEAELLESLQRELRQLHVEVDEAARAVAQARGQLVGGQ